MNADQGVERRPTRAACAPSDKQPHWTQLDWEKCNRYVRRLQARIVRATKEGKWGKVKALQRLLTTSHSGKALAVRRVTENRGKSTPGVDGETWSTPEAKAAALENLKRRGYKPQPLRRVNIPKANGKLRPLGIPTMTDRAMQALHKLALEPVAETLADGNSYGFRPKRATHDALEQLFINLARSDSPQWILEGGIKGCFDHIDHEWLVRHVCMDKAILRKWLKAGVFENGQLKPTESGTPQGGIISPVLANIALDGLEEALERRFAYSRRAGKHSRMISAQNQVHLIRYADDFVITGKNRELLEEQVLPLVRSFMAERGLQLSVEKTKVTHIEDGFDFLGQNVRKYNGKFLIKPSPSSATSYLRKIREVVRANKAATQSDLIGMLNPIIKGWGDYHRHAVSKDIFQKLDHLVWTIIWQWAKRRHPKKSSPWVYDKYYRAIDGRRWMFAYDTGAVFPDGKPILRVLRTLGTIPIVRHTKVKAGANLFDPEWDPYFDKRETEQILLHLEGRKKLLNLWKRQNGRCPLCGERITKETGWHRHHRQLRSKGGSDKMDNLVLVHDVCHAQEHDKLRRTGDLSPGALRTQ